jgi:hypothetical protein
VRPVVYASIKTKKMLRIYIPAVTLFPQKYACNEEASMKTVLILKKNCLSLCRDVFIQRIHFLLPE